MKKDIEPFIQENVMRINPLCYKLTLSENFHKIERRSLKYILDIYQYEGKSWYENKQPEKAIPIKLIEEKYHIKITNSKKEDRVIFMEPKETIITFSKEEVGGILEVKPIPFLEENMIRVIGWKKAEKAKITFKITNESQHAIPLIVGKPIGYAIF